MMHKVNFSEIVFIEGCRNYVKIHTQGTIYMSLTNMKDLEDILPGDHFIRIHKSFIVNVDRINLLSKNEVCINKQQCFPVGETFRDKVDSFISSNLI
jgi:DNA-binding LytR/AlgR family response regulator